mmetsp:Transcript_21906/g.19446  ORF Transcript_21906/g.19446 Transcript_21906/m.19446 type:complete len:261 (-) Transcript_21906:307-1089(-)
MSKNEKKMWDLKRQVSSICKSYIQEFEAVNLIKHRIQISNEKQNYKKQRLIGYKNSDIVSISENSDRLIEINSESESISSCNSESDFSPKLKLRKLKTKLSSLSRTSKKSKKHVDRFSPKMNRSQTRVIKKPITRGTGTHLDIICEDESVLKNRRKEGILLSLKKIQPINTTNVESSPMIKKSIFGMKQVELVHHLNTTLRNERNKIVQKGKTQENNLRLELLIHAGQTLKIYKEMRKIISMSNNNTDASSEEKTPEVDK